MSRTRRTPTSAGPCAVLLLLALIPLTGCDPTAPELLEGNIGLEALDLLHQVNDGDDEVRPLFVVRVDAGVARATLDAITALTVEWPDGTVTPLPPSDFVRDSEGHRLEVVDAAHPGPLPGGVYRLRISFTDDERIVQDDHGGEPPGRVEFQEFTLTAVPGETDMAEARLRWVSPPAPNQWEAFIILDPDGVALVVREGIRGAGSGGNRHEAAFGMEIRPDASYAFRVVTMTADTRNIADYRFSTADLVAAPPAP